MARGNDLCNTFLHVARVKKKTAMRKSHAFRMGILRVRHFCDLTEQRAETDDRGTLDVATEDGTQRLIQARLRLWVVTGS